MDKWPDGGTSLKRVVTEFGRGLAMNVLCYASRCIKLAISAKQIDSVLLQSSQFNAILPS